MKSWFILLFFLLTSGISFAQQEGLPKANPQSQILTHKGYTLSFNPFYRIADWVAYNTPQI